MMAGCEGGERWDWVGWRIGCGGVGWAELAVGRDGLGSLRRGGVGKWGLVERAGGGWGWD